MADVDLGKVVKRLEEPAYVVVGFGVLGFQRAQVCRRELRRHLGRVAANPKLAEVAGDIAAHIPEEARELLKAAGDLASDFPGEARELLKEALAIGRFAVRVVQGPATRRTYP